MKRERKALVDMSEPEIGALLKSIGAQIDGTLRATYPTDHQPRPMWTLLVWDDPGLAQYISSCDRSTAVQALRECADRLEAKEDVRRY